MGTDCSFFLIELELASIAGKPGFGLSAIESVASIAITFAFFSSGSPDGQTILFLLLDVCSSSNLTSVSSFGLLTVLTSTSSSGSDSFSDSELDSTSNSNRKVSDNASQNSLYSSSPLTDSSSKCSMRFTSSSFFGVSFQFLAVPLNFFGLGLL